MKKILAFLLAALMIVPALCACGKKDQTLVRLNEVTHSVFYAPRVGCAAMSIRQPRSSSRATTIFC